MGHVVTIDGPAGVGKSTAAKGLAKRLGWMYLDSGSLYRAVAWLARRMGLDIEAPEGRRKAVLALAQSVRFQKDEEGLTRIVVGAEVPGNELRTDDMAVAASIVAKDILVRTSLLPVQQGMAREGNVVAEGRDMGSVVFPSADAKFFLTASSRTRVERRVSEFEINGQNTEFEKVLSKMTQRDERDRTREISPLIPANDAIIVDTSELGIDQVQETLLVHMRERMPELGR